MSVLENMIIIESTGKQTKYLINTQVAPHVQDKTVADILKYYPDNIEIEFEKVC